MPRELTIVSFEDMKGSVRSGAKSANRPGEGEGRRPNPSWLTYDSESSDALESRRSNDAEAADEEETFEASSARDLRRRKRAKDRAGKMYDRQFGGSDTGEGGPRAALYKGKMGSSHKKASRMQGGGRKVDPLGAFVSVSDMAGAAAGAAREKVSTAASRTSVTPRSIKVITFLCCLVFACVFLYTPAQQYYHAQREHDRLEAEYASIESRNEALDVQNDILTSEAGMEDAVRQKFGYVKPDEEMAIVTGLSEEALDTSRDGENIEANVLSSSVKAPEEWYTPLLDAIFGVE